MRRSSRRSRASTPGAGWRSSQSCRNDLDVYPQDGRGRHARGGEVAGYVFPYWWMPTSRRQGVCVRVYADFFLFDADRVSCIADSSTTAGPAAIGRDGGGPATCGRCSARGYTGGCRPAPEPRLHISGSRATSPTTTVADPLARAGAEANPQGPVVRCGNFLDDGARHVRRRVGRILPGRRPGLGGYLSAPEQALCPWFVDEDDHRAVATVRSRGNSDAAALRLLCISTSSRPGR